MVNLSVVIVDFFKSERVVSSIQSLLSFSNLNLEVIVVDNSCDIRNSSVYSQIKNENVRYIVNSKNLGYTKAMNLGVNETKGDVVLVLNPDVIIPDEKIIEKCLSCLADDPCLGIVAPPQVNDDGTIPSIARRVPSLRQLILKRTLYKLGMFRKYVDSYSNPYGKFKVVSPGWIQSSCFLISRRVYELVDGFDERFFLFMADIDICQKVRQHGYDLRVIDSDPVIADGIRSSEGGITDIFKSPALRYHIKDAFKYYF